MILATSGSRTGLTLRGTRSLKFDFHCHSNHSDGTLSPTDLVARAAGCGVDYLALTDHDTISGLPEANAAAAEHGLNMVSGVELSVNWVSGLTRRAKCIHIVGLGFDPASEAFTSGLAEQNSARRVRAENMDEKLRAKGMDGVLERAIQIAGTEAVCRPHLARALLELGHVRNDREAWKRFLGDGKLCDIPVGWVSLAEGIQWIRDAGGVAVLAHPGHYRISKKQLVRLVHDFRDAGGDAIEVAVGGLSPDDMVRFAKLATRFGLRASTGSDFHDPEHSWRDLGSQSALPEGVEPVWELLPGVAA